MNPDLTNSKVNDPCSLVSAWYNYLGGVNQQHPGTSVSSVTREGTGTCFAPRPHVNITPRPYISSTPRPYVSAAHNTHVSTRPCPNVIAGPHPYFSGAPRPYVNATPYPYFSAAPRPYVAAAPRPYVAAAPRPYVTTAPLVIESAPAPPVVSAAAAHPYTSAAAAPPVVSASPPTYDSAAPPPIVISTLAFTSAPQVSLDYSKAAAASPAQSTAASKNSMSSSADDNQQASSRQQVVVDRPDFSLADSREDSHKQQSVTVSQTTSDDSRQFAPFVSKMQTLRPGDFSTNSVSVSSPKVMSTQESQICIGSVFSLAASDVEHHAGQPESENQATRIAVDNSASRKTLLDHPVLHEHQQNKMEKEHGTVSSQVHVSGEKEHDTISSHVHTTLSAKQNQSSALPSDLNTPLNLSPQGSSSNNICDTKELSHQITTSKSNVSIQVSSPKDGSQLLLDCATSISTFAAHQQSTSAVTSVKDVQLPVSQKNGSIITETEQKNTDVIRCEETDETSTSLTEPQDSSSTSQILPFTSSKVREPEIVDLDIEDIDDCMLVKIDLSRQNFTYGSKIHNSEVVIDDSDNDEDVLTKETSVASGETCSGKRDKLERSASATVIVGENDPCGATGSLSMEVEEIDTEASKTNSKQTTSTYTISSTVQTHVTSMMNTRANTQPSSKMYPQRSCSTWHTSQIENPESELMDLHVDDDDDECDDAAPATVEYVSLKVLTPSQPDKSVIQSMDLHVDDDDDDDDDECDDAAPATVEYVSLKVLTPSQPDKSVSTPVTESMDLHADGDECDDAAPATVECVSLKVLTPSQPDKSVSTPVTESMDLQADGDECDDAAPTIADYASLKVLTASQPDKNVSSPVIQSMDLQVDDDDDECDDPAPTIIECVSLQLTPPQPGTNVSTPVIQSMFSSSSRLSSTTEVPVLKENYHSSCLEPAFQGQITENTLKHSKVPLFFSPENVRKGQVSQGIDSSTVGATVPRHESHHLHLDGATGALTNAKHSRMASPRATAIKSTTPRPKGKSMKHTTPRPKGKSMKDATPKAKVKSAKSLMLKVKIPSAARIQNKSPSHRDITSKTVESTPVSTETDSSLVCKLCFMVFSSRMELVTHTLHWHRSSQFVGNPKCDECGQGFANNSLLKLHKKVKCTSSYTTDVDPGTMVGSLDSRLQAVIKQNAVTGAPEVSSSSATFRGVVEPQPPSGSAMDISNSTRVDVSSVLNSFPEGNVVSNYSTAVVTEAATEKHPDFSTGDKPVSEELMQEDIKPVITSSGELLQRSDGPDHVLADGHPSVSDSHKCTTCQKMFSNSFQLSLHQQFSEGCKVARTDCVPCFVCAKTFTSNMIRYLHVLNNPECQEKIDRYCIRCSHLFNCRADKQAHLDMFNACQNYEQCIMNEFVKDPHARNGGRVEQNLEEPGNQPCPVVTACEMSQPDQRPALAQENLSSRQLTDTVPNSFQVSLPDKDKQHSLTKPTSKSHSEKPKGGEVVKQKPCVKAKPSAACPACKKKFATSAMLILHFNESPKCRVKICSASKVAKKISASEVAKKISASEVAKKISASEVAKKISASDRINVLKPVATPKSPGKTSTGNVKKSSSAADIAFRNVFCDISRADRSFKCKVCGAECISENDLTHHTEEKCKNLQHTKAAPQLKNLRIVLSRVSVMCQVCHLPFADDDSLAKHLHFNQSCQKEASERVKRVLELKRSHLDIDTLKRDGKRRSCEIVTGISSVTSNISMASATNRWITLSEQTPAVDIVINEKLAEGVDGHISSNCDQGNANDESKGHAGDNDKDELSSMSSSDEGNDMEESGSSSEDGNADYTCKQCCKTYASKSLLIKHNKSHHQSAHGKRTHCKVCTRKFHDLTGLQAHLLQFKFCFIPLTRAIWERKQDPQICNMCKKVLGSPKDLRKHCFKKMACRLRYVNMVLKNMKGKDHSSALPAAEAEKLVLKTAKEKDNIKIVRAAEAVVPVAEAEIPVLKTAKDNTKVVLPAEAVSPATEVVVSAAEAVLPVSKTGKENCESQSANEVSSSVQDCCSPVEVDLSNSNMDFEDGTSCIKISHVVSKPLIECLNCNGYFDDFQEHLLKQQSCLDFFGIRTNKCPIPVPFCYQCKTHFDDVGALQLHACKGLVAYTHICQTCGLKFTSAHNLLAHFRESLTCNKTNISSIQNSNHDRNSTFVDSSTRNQQGGMLASSSAVRDISTSSGEQLFHCLICVARFPTLRLLMEHSYQHVEERPISCDRCSITFLHYNQFVSHQAFHIRMDKEANILVERPQLSTFGASTSTGQNLNPCIDSLYTDKGTRIQKSQTMTHTVLSCIFCHQKFGSVKAKVAHLTSDHACLAMMKYVTENKLFIYDQVETEPFNRRAPDLNLCEFCGQNVSRKFYHYLNSPCFWRLEAAILRYRSSPHPQHPRVPYR